MYEAVQRINNFDSNVRMECQNWPSGPISTRTFYRYLYKHQMSIDKAIGRPEKVHELQRLIPLIKSMRECQQAFGVTKTYETLLCQSNGAEDFSSHMVYKAMNQMGVVKKSTKPKKVKRCQYTALLVNGIWHADIHFMPTKEPIHVVIDDKSRFCIGGSYIPDKTATTCAAFLLNWIGQKGPVGCLWTDNGGENTGKDMVNSLQQLGILQVRTRPYNPQQNGKIERFWQLLDRNVHNQEELMSYLDGYNKAPHMSLPQVETRGKKRHMTPLEAYTEWEKWKPNEAVEYQIHETG